MSRTRPEMLKSAVLIVALIDRTMVLLGEQGLTAGQQDVIAMLLVRMTSVEFLRALAAALRLRTVEEREAEVKYIVGWNRHTPETSQGHSTAEVER